MYCLLDFLVICKTLEIPTETHKAHTAVLPITDINPGAIIALSLEGIMNRGWLKDNMLKRE